MFAEQFLLIIFAAVVGYLVFYCIGFPTPAIMGPFVAVILLQNFLNFSGSLDDMFALVLQVLLGIHIGILMRKQVFSDMKHLLLSSILMVGWTLIMTFGMGAVLIRFFNIDVATALLSTAPAGVSETGLLAISVHADVGIVTAFQISRMLITVTMIPLLIKYSQVIKKNSISKSSYPKKVLQSLRAVGLSNRWISFRAGDILPYIVTVCVGVIGGVLGQWVRIPAGALMGSFLLVALFSMLGIHLRKPPEFVRIGMQIGIGLTLGVNVMQSSVKDIKMILVPIIVFTVIIFLTSYINYKILKVLNGWPDLTCMLAAAPAGMTPISALAFDYAENPLEICLMHMARLIAVKVIILPVIVIWLMNYT